MRNEAMVTDDDDDKFYHKQNINTYTFEKA